MRQLVLFIISFLDINENPQVMLTRTDADTRSGEFRADLVESSSRNSSFRAVNIEGRDRRMMRRLLGQITDFNRLFAAVAVDFCGAVGCVGARRGRDCGSRVLDLPSALETTSPYISVAMENASRWQIIYSP